MKRTTIGKILMCIGAAPIVLSLIYGVGVLFVNIPGAGIVLSTLVICCVSWCVGCNLVEGGDDHDR